MTMTVSWADDINIGDDMGNDAVDMSLPAPGSGQEIDTATETYGVVTQQELSDPRGFLSSLKFGSPSVGADKNPSEESTKAGKDQTDMQQTDPNGSTMEQFVQIVLAENKDFAMISGEKVMMPKVIIENSRTLVPLHFFREIKQAKVVFNPAEKSVTVASNNKVVRLVADQKEIRVNGQPKLLDVPMKIYGGRAYVPVRYIAEIFGYHVSFVKNSGAPTMIGICTKEGMLDYGKAIEFFTGR